jgi:hypothetical protein
MYMDYEEAMDARTRIDERWCVAIMKRHGVIEEEWAEGLDFARTKKGDYSSMKLLWWLGY